MDKVHFTYDLDFILTTLVPAFIETELKVDEKTLVVEVNKHQYHKHALINKYQFELRSGLFLDTIKNLLEEQYPDGCVLSKEIFEQLAKSYVKLLVENETEVFGILDEDNCGYVECPLLNARIYCRNANHYDAALVLTSMFFGMEDLLKDNYTYDDIIKFIQEHIIIHSRITSKQTIIDDLKKTNTYDIPLHIVFQRINSEHFTCEEKIMNI